MAATQKVEHIQAIGTDGIAVPIWGETKIKVYSVNYVWVISDFNFHRAKLQETQFLCSPIFADETTDNGCKWCLKLYPNRGACRIAYRFAYRYIDAAVYLVLHSTSSCSSVFATFELSVLGEDQKEVEVCKNNPVTKFDNDDVSWGWENFLGDGSKLPLNNKLTLHCKISYSFVNPSTTTFDQSHLIKVKSTDPELRLCKDLEILFRNEEMSDVVISVNGKKFKAHKTILAARSPVFAAMFKHKNMVENQQNVVNITDFNEQVVEEMLNYIYTDKSKNLKELAFSLLAASNKYGLEGLKKMSERALSENLSVENVMDVLIRADLHYASELKLKAINFIVAKSAEVMKSPTWRNTVPRCPQLLMAEICEALYHK